VTAIPVMASLGFGTLSYLVEKQKAMGMVKPKADDERRLWDFFDPQGHHQIDWN